MIRLSVLLFFWSVAAQAEVLVASRIIPANSIISADDIQLRDVASAGGVADPDQIVGMEARKALFAGRPILLADVGNPAVVERNQIIQLVFSRFGLVIKTEGRAMDRAAPGEMIRVMNLESRSLVTAKIDNAGVAYVLQ
ncbi:flagella basal body P-ring formation protein FlgA [Loktanella ponticola]|uniref:Flagella basal body P-ring formation protein FlgA n=1 Tax=Yoonia ponticola TaxID=1524255 RepID=A0A7W9EY46_9RHOB|nr:flagellar basal body P-ring formation chaperone FlgA [Yoonia ponticola]MBB5722319.1 flagella basal body P-ring formation protein FlgA [Yoonia ponticola]